MGLRPPDELGKVLREAQQAFIRAATSTARPEASVQAAREAMRRASDAGDLLLQAYTDQVFQSRLSTTSRLSTNLGCVLDVDPQAIPAALQWTRTFNSAQVGPSWRQVAPSEGQYRWELLDAQLAWCRRHRLAIEAGPLIEFRPGALPDWLWLFDDDAETIGGLVVNFVRQAVAHYKGKVPLWHVVHRATSARSSASPRRTRSASPHAPSRWPTRPTPRRN